MRDLTHLRRSLSRQVDHWTNAAIRLGHLEDLAAPGAWKNLEQYLGLSLRDHLRGVVERITRRGNALRAALAAADDERDLAAARRELLAFRRHYLRAETTVDFYADAINTRTSPVQGALLRALDTLAHRSMAGILEPIGYETPVALTYIDKGLGASILKAGLRLWDGGAVSPVAAIKIVNHNLDRPTALVHEAGHQVAHIAGWNEELARTLQANLGPSGSLSNIWAGWASEIAADAVAFVHTGYGAVLTLHDVLAGETGFVFQVVEGDPHPMSFLRIELGVQMCRLAWGDDGPWNELAQCWREAYPLNSAPSDARALVIASMPKLPAIARLTLATPMRAFRGRSLVDIMPPSRVSPKALADLELRLGPALYTSSHWIWTESLRLLALSALGENDKTLRAGSRASFQEWMLRLGGMQQAA
jgi:hypothetical protein